MFWTTEELERVIKGIDATREEWLKALDNVLPPSHRYSVEPTSEWVPQPFGPDTVQLVSEEQGGAIAYFHEDNLDDVLRAFQP